MIIGNHAVIDRGLEADFLMVGEGVHISGEVNTDDDMRADVWCRFENNVNIGGDAYIGEFTIINGKIVVEGDLDVGKEVKLNGGFLSKGWVVVRNPLPVMIFIFMYIRAMIGIGKSSDEIDKALNDMFEDDEEIDFENMDENKITEVINRGGFCVIPIGTKILGESINVPENVFIGNDCFVDAKIICKQFESGKNLSFNGSIRTKGETLIGEGSKITGEINTTGKLIIDKNVKISGKITAKTVWIHETSFVEGKITSGNIRFITGSGFDIKDSENAEKATLLSKSDSFEMMKTNITEKKEESEEDVDIETENYIEADSNDRNVEEKESEAEMEKELTEGEAVEKSESFVSEDVENEKAEKHPSKRSQKRRTKKQIEQRENLKIVNAFTGENLEESKPINETFNAEEQDYQI